MITHVVVFWTDKPVAEAQAKLLAGLEPLKAIEGVKNFRMGPAIENNRGVADDSFAVAISMDFDDQAQADAYQTHPLHVEFLKTYVGPIAKRVTVYDFAS